MQLLLLLTLDLAPQCDDHAMRSTHTTSQAKAKAKAKAKGFNPRTGGFDKQPKGLATQTNEGAEEEHRLQARKQLCNRLHKANALGNLGDDD